MADITVSRGDYGFDLTFTVQTATSGVFDLSGKVVTFKTWRHNSPFNIVASASCTLTGATTGVCTYTVGSTAFLIEGLYDCELEMSEAGKVDSTKLYSIQVVESP